MKEIARALDTAWMAFADSDIADVGLPNELVIPAKTYIHLGRRFMTRRGYRRWRARQRIMFRQAARNA